ncbi:MAG: GGDEF domain-containing protein [Acidobacteriota bacterium]
MPTGLMPYAVELLTTLLFLGVLIYLRKSLTGRSVAFWMLLWAARGAVSLFAARFVSSAESLVPVLYAPLQILFSMALVAIAVRLEHQKEQLRTLNDELDRLRHEAAGQQDFDPLTGLRNRSALARWLESGGGFEGLVVVCDMDDFKQFNDNYGHLVGDEILHGVGKLIGNSIRDEDLAFRWGGDEFVIFFHTSDRELVEARMKMIEERLAAFRIRQHGTIPVRFSWGLTSTPGRSLRDCLEEADRFMYEVKRARRVSGAQRA